jgi:3-oxoacyl-[acyl-carrier-protein] synthase III
MLQSSRTLRAVGITGLGSYLPEKIVTNEDLIASGLETTSEWIYQKIGIRERRIAAPGEATSDMAIHAARRALDDAGITAADVDLIIVTSMNFDYKTPATAAIVQNALGARCGAFDLGSACSGFVYACAVASKFVQDGMMNTVLVVASEHNSSLVSWQDRTTCVYFGDGAGAAVIQPVREGYGFLGFDLGADGSGEDAIKVPGGGSRHPVTPENVQPTQIKQGVTRGLQHFTMNGHAVYEFVQNKLPQTLGRAAEQSGSTLDQLDFFVLHQANRWMVGDTLQKMNVPLSKTFFNLDRYGNMASASVPVALHEARDAGCISDGNLVALSGFGAGLAWATTVVRWGGRL